MGNALFVGGLRQRIGDVGAPIAALRAVSIEQAVNMVTHVTEWVRFGRKQRRRGELHRYVRILRKRDRLLDRDGYRLVPQGLGRYPHMVDDEDEVGVALGDRCKQWRLA